MFPISPNVNQTFNKKPLGAFYFSLNTNIFYFWIVASKLFAVSTGYGQYEKEKSHFFVEKTSVPYQNRFAKNPIFLTWISKISQKITCDSLYFCIKIIPSSPISILWENIWLTTKNHHTTLTNTLHKKIVQKYSICHFSGKRVSRENQKNTPYSTEILHTIPIHKSKNG